MRQQDFQPIDAVLDFALGGCECGKPPDGFVKVGPEMWMTHSRCGTRWLALHVPSWLRVHEETLEEHAPELLAYREIPGHTPEWARQAFQREVDRLLCDQR